MAQMTENERTIRPDDGQRSGVGEGGARAGWKIYLVVLLVLLLVVILAVLWIAGSAMFGGG